MKARETFREELKINGEPLNIPEEVQRAFENVKDAMVRCCVGSLWICNRSRYLCNADVLVS